jgi:hypothetical protein
VTLNHGYRGRRAASIENDAIRVTVLAEGGHIAEVLDKRTGVNPLWTPPWPSIEPSSFDAIVHRDAYGDGADAKLLAGIAGLNVCLDIFGGPSAEEAAAGMTAHGDAPVAAYDIAGEAATLRMRALLPLAQIRFERRIELDGSALNVFESIQSLCRFDRPIAWTEHVTLGPPFLERGRTEFRASATRSRVFESEFGVADYLRRGAEFDWPNAPRTDGSISDLRLFTDAARSSAYTAHLMDPTDDAFFVAFAPGLGLAFGCVWTRNDFPWMGIWEENRSRSGVPWNGQTLTRGMEFGVSPFPETRRAAVDRGRLFGAPTYRWLPANARLDTTYSIVVQHVDRIPERLDRVAK